MQTEAMSIGALAAYMLLCVGVALLVCTSIVGVVMFWARRDRIPLDRQLTLLRRAWRFGFLIGAVLLLSLLWTAARYLPNLGG
jgi:hypothetical protein